MKKLYLLFALIAFHNATSQTIVNQAIDGENTEDLEGYAVKLSRDGSTMVISAPLHGTTESNIGKVRIFKNLNNSWMQQGNTLFGDSGSRFFGLDVDINANGDRIVIYQTGPGGSSKGQINVYQLNNTTWSQLGQTLTGTNAFDTFGETVSINDEGDIIALGIPKTDAIAVDAGEVRVFQLVNNSWQQRGQTISGSTNGESLGSHIELDASGNTLIVGNPNTNTLRAYKINNNVWTQIANTINGTSNHKFGYEATVSSNGNIIAAVEQDEDFEEAIIKVFEKNGTSWSPLGQTIPITENTDSTYGGNMAINGLGNLIAVRICDTSETDVLCHLDLYQLRNNVWTLIGQPIDATINQNTLAQSTDLDQTGNLIAIGAEKPNTNSEFGYTRLFTLENLLSTSDFGVRNTLSIYPNPANTKIHIDTTLENFETLKIIDLHGRIVLQRNNPTSTAVDVSNIANGLYVVLAQKKGKKYTSKLLIAR